MVTYTRFVNAIMPGGFGYKADGKIVSFKRIPHDVTIRFDYGAESVEYDDKPDHARCLFCDAYREHIRIFQGVSVALCDFHYYDKNIGQIAAQLRKDKEKADGNEKPKRTSKTVKPGSRKNRHARRHASSNRSSGQGQGAIQ